MKYIAFTIKLLLVLGFTMWAFLELIPDEKEPYSNTVEVVSDFEAYGLKY